MTAFFTRSSAANIPVNMRLCEELGLNPDTYSVSIPLGSTIKHGRRSRDDQYFDALLLPIPYTFRLTLEQRLSSVLWQPSLLVEHPELREDLSFSSLLLVASLASPMIWPCKSSVSAFIIGVIKTLAKQPSTLRQMCSSLPSPK